MEDLLSDSNSDKNLSCKALFPLKARSVLKLDQVVQRHILPVKVHRWYALV